MTVPLFGASLEIPEQLLVFLISMAPVIELRGAIPTGVALGLPFWECYLLAVLGNMLPVPFLIPFSKAIVRFLAKQKFIGPFFQRVINKADRTAQNIGRYELAGLALFVAIPLPGTGAWTGALVAAILRLRLVPSLVAILCGVLVSGIIVGVLSVGVSNLAGLF